MIIKNLKIKMTDKNKQTIQQGGKAIIILVKAIYSLSKTILMMIWQVTKFTAKNTWKSHKWLSKSDKFGKLYRFAWCLAFMATLFNGVVPAIITDEIVQAEEYSEQREQYYKVVIPEAEQKKRDEAHAIAIANIDKAKAANFETAQANLLDLIASKESGGDYNSIFWGATFYPEKPLVEMTVREARQYQTDLLSQGAKSTALGKYQIISPTMDGTIARLGLTGDELFDEEMQDKMAIGLLDKRGYQDFLYEKIDANTFCNYLAMEWASFGVCTYINGKARGQSYYAGDGLNAAHVSPDTVLEALSKYW